MLLSLFLEIYTGILIARVLMSWFNPNPYNPLVQFVLRLTEPVLAPIRKVLPSMGGLDLSPIVVFVALMFVKRLIH